MAANTITSASNPRLKAWSQLLTRKGRAAQGKYLLEGIHLVADALRAGAALEAVLYAEERGMTHEVEAALEARGGCIELIAVPGPLLAKCTETDTPQGVVGVAVKPEPPREALFAPTAALGVVVDGVQDPGNLGTIIRSADAAGADYVVLGTGTVDLYNPKTIRATMGSLFHLPVYQGDLQELLPAAAAHGIRVVSAALGATKSCYEADLAQPVWIVVGNEGSGVSAAWDPYITERVIIPMRGRAESLNVAMAATILLFEAQRQRIG